jgi:uncharacterized repeat protein (TIGR03803 family)
MRRISGWISYVRWRPALGLVAGIMLMLTVVVSSQRGAFGQLSSDLGPAQAVVSGLSQEGSAAPTYTVLYRFTGGTDGANPYAGLARDSAGNLYGTTHYGGESFCTALGCGTVFKVSPTGTETVLHRFTGGADGGVPYAGLMRDAVGSLFGTATNAGGSGCDGGCGTVFKVSPTGALTVPHSFHGADGAYPSNGLIEDAAGNLYGTTGSGGAHGGGAVFQLSPCHSTYSFKVLYSFTGGADGLNPAFADLIRDSAGNLYGTTIYGGDTSTCDVLSVPGCGVVFKLSPSGMQTVLYRFSGGADSAFPTGGLIRDAGGNL